MNRDTPAERAVALLEIHGGRCFVPEGNDLIAPFREMEEGGLVVISESISGNKGINVWSTGFISILEPHEDEPQAH